MRLISLVLSLILLLPVILKTGVLIDFATHQDFIAKNLCENRSKPQLQCDGKCILMKKLQEVSQERKTEEPNQFPESLQIELSHFVFDNSFHLEKQSVAVATDFYVRNVNLPGKIFLSGIFKPPQV